MATVLLVRHGVTAANTSGVLAGRTPGVLLSDAGKAQVDRLAQRLAGVPLARVVTSPLERCVATAAAIVRGQVPGSLVGGGAGGAAGSIAAAGDSPTSVDELAGLDVEPEIIEVDYGDWQGRRLADLAKEDLWQTVQRHPAAAHFPGGEPMAHMQARAVAAIRRLDRAVESEHGAGAVWVAVSHGDIIKSVLADALGMHLDLFQRISVAPASVSIVRYGPARPDVVATNTDAGDLSWLTQVKAVGDAPVGGGAGHGEPNTPGGGAGDPTAGHPATGDAAGRAMDHAELHMAGGAADRADEAEQGGDDGTRHPQV